MVKLPMLKNERNSGMYHMRFGPVLKHWLLWKENMCCSMYQPRMSVCGKHQEKSCSVLKMRTWDRGQELKFPKLIFKALGISLDAAIPYCKTRSMLATR